MRSTSLSLRRFFPALLWRVVAQVALIVAGSVLLALSARVAVPLPFSPIPVTGQTLGVLLLAGLLGRRSVASVVLYLGQVAVGMPVLAGGLGGLAALAGPTGGYLLGFVLAAYVAGWLVERSGGRWAPILGALFVGEALIYGCGLLWLSHFLPAAQLPLAGLYPFLAGDAYKLAVAFGIVHQVRSRG